MLPQGTMLRGGTYRIERQLASGGFGNTYLVRNVAFNELYAMKEFFMRGVNMRQGDNVTVSVPDNHATFDSQKEKFKKEAIRLRNLHNDHIVAVHDLFEERKTAYYVMDFIDGQSMAELIKNTGKPVSEEQMWNILPQLLDALGAVHEQSIWHLDIKPGNIMLDRNGRAYLIDFGASKQLSNSGSQTSSALCYTPGYAPVEQVEQAMDKFGPWTDFYALGATLYFLQTLQQPPSSTAIAEGDAFNFPQAMSNEMRALIRWMMQPTRKKRPQSVKEITGRLAMSAPTVGTTQQATKKNTEESAATVAAVVSKPEGKKKGGGAWKIIVPVIILLAALAVGAYFLFLHKSDALVAAEEAQEAYEEKVEKCREAIQNADTFAELDDAQMMFRAIEKLEDEHSAELPEVYDQLDDLKKLYDKEMKTLKEEYLSEASSYKARNNYRRAYDMYKEAADMLPDDEDFKELVEETARDMGYVYILDAKVANKLNGEVINEASHSLPAEDIRYLTTLLTYNSLLPSGHSPVDMKFTFKYIDADGDLHSSSSSPAGYTTDSKFEVLVGEHEQGVWLDGWGNSSVSTYSPGEYTFELYHDGNMIFSNKFTLY